jgi:hypothetical protein
MAAIHLGVPNDTAASRPCGVARNAARSILGASNNAKAPFRKRGVKLKLSGERSFRQQF